VENKTNKKNAAVGGSCVSEREQVRLSLFSVDIVNFMRPVAYTHMREMCLSRVFVDAFFGREIICSFLCNRQRVLYCVRVFAVCNYCRTFGCREAMTITIIIMILIG